MRTGENNGVTEMEERQYVGPLYTDQSVSTIHHSLRASRRRLTILLVAEEIIKADTRDKDTDQPQKPPVITTVSVRQIAREIVAVEEDVPIEHATGDDYHSVYTSLIQTHLPKLDDVGAIEYDSDRKLIGPDKNLIALATVATITSPVAQLLFQKAIADLYFGGRARPEDAISD